MKALTICQPYAELIARGDKLIENRSWFTHYRGPLAIHAGLSRAGRYRDAAERWAMEFEALPRGQFVAVAELAACVRVADVYSSNWLSSLPDDDFADYFIHAEGPWCWILKDVRRIDPPIHCKGRQGLWEPEMKIKSALYNHVYVA